MIFKIADSAEALSSFEVAFVLALSISVEAIGKAKKGYYVPQNTQPSTDWAVRTLIRPEEWECLYTHVTSSECPNDIFLTELLLQPEFLKRWV